MQAKKKKVKKGLKKTNSKNKKNRLKIIKWTTLIVLIIGAVAMFLLSDLFNTKQIKVINNNKVLSEEIINLSGIKINENMFKFLGFKAEEQIRQNPYIEEAKIHRKLDGTIEINVKERVATYMLELDEGEFAYINNQGYILEKSLEKLKIPVLTGYVTKNIEPGGRLEVADLQKLNIVIQIMNTAKQRDLSVKISHINIEDNKDFLLTMESENKLIHFGDSTYINEKFVKLLAVLEDTVGQKGEIFIKNIDKMYFRKEV